MYYRADGIWKDWEPLELIDDVQIKHQFNLGLMDFCHQVNQHFKKKTAISKSHDIINPF